jgi:hypothetical protein
MYYVELLAFFLFAFGGSRQERSRTGVQVITTRPRVLLSASDSVLRSEILPVNDGVGLARVSTQVKFYS